jgi:hypothetical protein
MGRFNLMGHILYEQAVKKVCRREIIKLRLWPTNRLPWSKLLQAALLPLVNRLLPPGTSEVRLRA